MLLLTANEKYQSFSLQPVKRMITAGYRYWVIFWLALCLTVSWQNTYAESLPQQLKFTHLSSKQGLAQNTVHALTQDKEGFIWIATQSGLHRYDGYQFQSYNHNPENENSLASNLVMALTTDNDGILWAGTFPAAINKFNPAKGYFTTIQFPQLKTRGVIQQLFSSGDFLWIAVDNQFFILNKSSQIITPLSISDKKEEKAITIAEDNNNNIWLVKQTGLYSIQKNNSVIKKNIDLKLPENDLISSAILQDDLFYLGTTQGNLYRFNIFSAHLDKLWTLTDEKKVGASTELSSIALTNTDVWIASKSSGLIKFSLNDNSAQIFTHNDKKPSSLSENNLLSILIDNSGLIWVGTTVSGVERTNGKSGFFALYQDINSAGSFNVNNDIRAVLVTNDGKYWLASNEGLLKRFMPETNTYTHYSLPKMGDAININLGPASLIETVSGDILYGSKFGLWKFSPEDEAFYRLDITDENGVYGEAVLSFYKDNQGRIWAGSSNAGIGLYDENLEKIEWFPATGDTLKESSNFILHLIEAGDNLLWVGSSKGLILFNTSTLEYQTLNIINEDSHSTIDSQLKNSVIRTLFQAMDGTLWVGTLSGVFSLKPINENWQISYPFAHIKSLSSNIYAFLTDASSNLWISSNFGLTRITPNTGEHQLYTSHDGLQGEEFNGNIAFKTGDNRLWFGGLNGLNSFNPEKLQQSTFQPPVWVTGFQIDDKFQQVQNPAFFSELVLPEDTQLLKLEFSSLDYSFPERNRYRIRIGDAKQEWLDLGNTHEITYSKLQAGTYKICLMGSNQNAIWNPTCRPLLVTLKAHFWQTGIAYFIYFIGLLIVTLSLFYLQKRKRQLALSVNNEIKSSREKLSWALEGSGDALWIWDVKSGEAYRQGLDRLLGYSSEGVDNPNTEIAAFIHPDDVALTQKHIEKKLKSNRNEYYEIEYRMKAASGKWLWILDRGMVVERDKNNQSIKIAGTFRDISHRKKAEEESQLSALIIRNMAEMVLVTDENFRILSANPSWCHKMGYQLHELLGKDPAIFNSSEISPEFYQSVRDHLLKFGSWQGEMPHMKKNSQEIMTFTELTSIKNSDQSIRHIVAVSSDITAKKKAEEELRHLANYDTLTNLPNRTLFNDRLEHAILQAQRNQTTLALLFIDLDNFKNINDTLGHSSGDLLLKETAQIITQCVRKDDTVSRLGGDEFTVILENISDGVSVFHLAEKIIESFTDAIQINQRMISITPSIGISLYPDDTTHASSLVQFADTAMYFAKSQGKNNFQFYAEEMNKNALRRLEIESHLRTALENQEFHIAYQPKVNTVSGKITGMEALLRWNNPVIGQISPVEFIPLAEDSGLIVPIGEWVLLNACQQAKKWVDTLDSDLNISVNLSFRQFKDQNLPEIVVNILKQTGLNGQNLTLEITESLLMDNVEKATQQLHQLKNLGVKIAIDDFGTGYSSLNYLKQFPLDYLKIDRTFIRDILTNKNDASLTSAIISLSHNLDLAVIAEGVELTEQLAFLEKSGCEEIQGFLVSPPIAGPLFEKLLLQSKNKNIFSLLNEKK